MRIKKTEYIEGYKLRILFNNNKEKVVDLEKELYGPIYKQLKDVNYFKKVFVDPDLITVQWPNGEDFSPDLLYEMGIEVKGKKEGSPKKRTRRLKRPAAHKTVAKKKP